MIIYSLIAVVFVLFITITYFSVKLAKLKIQLAFIENIYQDEKVLNSKLESEKIEYIQKIEQLISKTKYQDGLIAEFEQLQKASHEQTKSSLFELGNQLSKQLIELHKQENQESRALSEKKIGEVTNKFNSEFERIVSLVGALSKEVSQSKDTVDVIKNSLLSPSGAGALAEITLENILKSSGLRSDIDYIMQYSAIDDEDNTYRPDAVIFLPGNKLMIIDAKASKFLVDEVNNQQNLAKTMNNHLKSLSSKNYAQTIKRSVENKGYTLSNTVTLMFVPTEHAIEKIIEADRDFMNKSWKANIFPVGPAGIMNMLSFAKFQISEQLMIKNHILIIEEVKKLLSSVGIMAEYSSKLGNSISGLVSNYDKFAASFNRNFLSKAQKLSDMGVESGLKKDQDSLKRLQLFSSKSEIIESNNNEELTLKPIDKHE